MSTDKYRANRALSALDAAAYDDYWGSAPSTVRQMHINDIAHCWWESDFLYAQHWACESNVFPGTFYHNVSHWSFG